MSEQNGNGEIGEHVKPIWAAVGSKGPELIDVPYDEARKYAYAHPDRWDIVVQTAESARRWTRPVAIDAKGE